MTDENEIETESPESEVEEPSKPESAEETARAVWEELKAAAPEEDDKPAEKDIDPSEAGRALAKSKKAKKRQTFVPAEDKEAAAEPAAPAPVTQDPELEPPQHWEVANKEWFHRQPLEVKKEALKWFKNAQAQTTRALQELNRERSAAQEINEVTSKHLQKLDTRGMSAGQVIDQLFSFQHQINEDDVGAIIEMMRYRNLSLADLQDRLENGGAPKYAQNNQQQQQTYLTPQDLERIMAERDEKLNQQRATEAATEEVRSLMREMDAQGRYVYPELHDPQYVQRIQYLISHVRANNPDASWKEAYRQAVLTDRQTRGVTTGTHATAPRLTSKEIQTVKQASSSLRSRGGNGAIPRSAEPKPGETARESAEAAYYEVFGDKQH